MVIEVREAPVPVRWAWRMHGEPVDMCVRPAWSTPFDERNTYRSWDILETVSADWSLSVLLSNGQIVIVRAKK